MVDGKESAFHPAATTGTLFHLPSSIYHRGAAFAQRAALLLDSLSHLHEIDIFQPFTQDLGT